MSMEWLPEAVMNFFDVIGSWLGAAAYIAIVAGTIALLSIGGYLLIRKVIAPAMIGLYNVVRTTSSDSKSISESP